MYSSIWIGIGGDHDNETTRITARDDDDDDELEYRTRANDDGRSGATDTE